MTDEPSEEDAILLVSEAGEDIMVSISPKGFEITPEAWGSMLYNIVVQLVSGYADDNLDPLETRKKILSAFDGDRMKSYLDGEFDVSGDEH